MAETCQKQKRLELGPSHHTHTRNSVTYSPDMHLHRPTRFLSLVHFPCFRHTWCAWRGDLGSLSWYRCGGLSSPGMPKKSCLLTFFRLCYLEAPPWKLYCCPWWARSPLLWTALMHGLWFHLDFLLDWQFLKHKDCLVFHPPYLAHVSWIKLIYLMNQVLFWLAQSLLPSLHGILL